MNEGGDLNRAMLHFMLHHDNVCSPIDAIMDAYARQCAVSVDCVGLAQAGCYLADTRMAANAAGDRAKRMRTALALMMTCGHRTVRAIRGPCRASRQERRRRRYPGDRARHCLDRSVVAQSGSARQFDARRACARYAQRAHRLVRLWPTGRPKGAPPHTLAAEANLAHDP